MLPLGLFARHNFAVGNIETLAMYGGLILFFLLSLFLQEVAHWTPDRGRAGHAADHDGDVRALAGIRRVADRYGPRFFMGAGPLFAPPGCC